MDITPVTKSSKRRRGSLSVEIDDSREQLEAPDLAPVQRTRGATACQRCRSRKTKCNNVQPCAYCSRIGAECIYDDDTLLYVLKPCAECSISW